MRVRRLPRTLAPFAAALVTVAVVAAIAGAHDTDFNDPDDTRGKLDIEQVRLAHQPGPPKWTLATFGEWRTAEIWDRGYLMVFLDTQGGAGAEHYLLVRSSGVVLEGSLWRLRNVGPDSYLGSVPVEPLVPSERHGPGRLVPAHLRCEPRLLPMVGGDALHR